MRHVGTLGMGVVRAYSQQGIGSSLLARAIEHAWGSGLKRLELQVFADNAPAIALYERHGYEIEGRQRYARLPERLPGPADDGAGPRVGGDVGSA